MKAFLNQKSRCGDTKVEAIRCALGSWPLHALTVHSSHLPPPARVTVPSGPVYFQRPQSCRVYHHSAADGRDCCLLGTSCACKGTPTLHILSACVQACAGRFFPAGAILKHDTQMCTHNALTCIHYPCYRTDTHTTTISFAGQN